MVLPLSLLRAASNHPLLVELKNGETYSGTLVGNDGFMNLHLKTVVCTSKDGDKFWKMPICYIRGSSIKYVRFSEDVVAAAREFPDLATGASSGTLKQSDHRGGRGRGRGRGRSRGRGSSHGGGRD
eukprot:Gregarina_sp_Poly_1__2897@NODE_180_length_11843_cov_115_676376_g160_i0_p12_GENE_NODE_180_length_11843_cov_115_676376_g160_i0NODE_180_length_11843_cov_115_676376_g160_i0_p12_ORF_typecomplete_len126_score9_33LSM/PF01423_22/3_4e16SMATX/PF14438_6/0_084FoP_duplication/PF13865_6/2_8_NODE_180_length_11843_cov_115_676376_g160_i025662943